MTADSCQARDLSASPDIPLSTLVSRAAARTETPSEAPDSAEPSIDERSPIFSPSPPPGVLTPRDLSPVRELLPPSERPGKGFLFRAANKECLRDVVVSSRFLKQSKRGVSLTDTISRALNVDDAYPQSGSSFQNDMSGTHAFIHAPMHPSGKLDHAIQEDCVALSYLLEEYGATVDDDPASNKVSRVFIHASEASSLSSLKELDVFRTENGTTAHGRPLSSFFVFGSDPKSKNAGFYRVWDIGAS
jgi:hypothetical protein